MAERKSLTWSEPSFFKRQDRKYAWPPKYAHAVLGVTSAIFFLIPIIVPPKEGLMGTLGIIAIGLVVGLLGGYGISALDLLLPAIVSVNRVGITRIDSFLITSIPILAMCRYPLGEFRWNEIARGTIHVTSDHRLQCIVTIEGHDNQPLVRFGVPRKVDIHHLVPFFENAGISLVIPK